MKVIKQSKTFQGGTQESYSLKLLRTVLEGPPAVVQGIDIDPQGRFVAYADKSTKYFISGLDTGETVRVSHKSLETGIIYSSDWYQSDRLGQPLPMESNISNDCIHIWREASLCIGLRKVDYH